MNREIKFRGLGYDNKWYYGYYYRVGDIHYIQYTISSVSVNPFTISQFTNLKDKNCVEVYEGDIIELFNDGESFGHKYNIQFENCMFVLYHTKLSNYNGGKLKWGGIYRILDIGIEIKKIGNIYENPELLQSGSA